MQHRKLYAALGGMVLAGTTAVAGFQASSASESEKPAAAPGEVHLQADLVRHPGHEQAVQVRAAGHHHSGRWGDRLRRVDADLADHTDTPP